MTDEAATAGLRVDATAYREHVTVPIGQKLPADHVLGRIHTCGPGWALLG